MQPVWLIGKLYRTEVPKCNRKLYSPVLSCTHHGKIPAAKPGFVCFADKIGFVFAFLVFISAGFSCTGETRPGKACAGKAVLGQKSPKGREFGVVYGWAGIGADALRTRPNRGISRGDTGGVWGCCGVVLSYNFLPESKTYILVRWAFHLREPSDIGIHISQWNQSCAFILLVRMRICLADLHPKLPPKGVGTGQHRIAPFCTHGTKAVSPFGTQYHQTQQNNIPTHKL